MLEHFYAEVNNEKGEAYEPESLKAMMALIDRHLKNKGCTLSIARDREFSSSKEVLEDKAKELHLAILGDPGEVSRVGRKGGTNVFKYGRKSPWVPTLTELFPKIQADTGS